MNTALVDYMRAKKKKKDGGEHRERGSKISWETGIHQPQALRGVAVSEPEKKIVSLTTGLSLNTEKRSHQRTSLLRGRGDGYAMGRVLAPTLLD